MRLPNGFDWRDTVLFLSGLGLIFFEALIREGPERPTLIILYAGMVGLPLFKKADEKASPESLPDKVDTP